MSDNHVKHIKEHMKAVSSTDLTVNGTNHTTLDICDTSYFPTDLKEELLEYLREEMGEQDYIKMLEEEMQRYKIETSPLYKVLNDGK